MLTDYENFHRTINLIIAVVISLVIGLILGRQFSEGNLIRSYISEGVDGPAPLPRFYTDLPDLAEEVFPSIVLVETRVGGSERRASGFLISGAGHVATSFHVIEGAGSVKVVLPDRESLDARVLGTDQSGDLAILKVDRYGLPSLALGDSRRLRRAESLLAFGSPLGLTQSVCRGILSGLDRPVPGLDGEGRLQIDAMVLPGNSGGPVVNVDGRVVGIITSAPEEFRHFGFATPSRRLQVLHDRLVADGRIVYPWIGAGLLEVTPDIAQRHSLKTKRGSFVETLLPESPGRRGGLQVGDVILSIDGSGADNPGEFIRLLRACNPDGQVMLEVRRGAGLVELPVTLEPLPPGKYSPGVG
jgi:serine protease Do